MTDEQTAAAIVAEHEMSSVNAKSMEAAIVRALQAARTPPAGHIIDEQGVVRRVLGQLPLTADGCVFGIDAPTVYAWHHGEPMGAACVAESQQCDECGNEDMYEASECYSTREACRAANEMVDGEAAEAAKEAK